MICSEKKSSRAGDWILSAPATDKACSQRIRWGSLRWAQYFTSWLCLGAPGVAPITGGGNNNFAIKNASAAKVINWTAHRWFSQRGVAGRSQHASRLRRSKPLARCRTRGSTFGNWFCRLSFPVSFRQFVSFWSLEQTSAQYTRIHKFMYESKSQDLIFFID